MVNGESREGSPTQFINTTTPPKLGGVVVFASDSANVIANAPSHVIASEAKQSRGYGHICLDCFVASSSQ
ncbi:hypothetical protein EHLJMEHL_01697 [Vreelandella titanicae]|jgi:hypothetical protein